MPADVASILSPMRPIPAGVPRFGAALGPVFRGNGTGSFAGAFPDGVTSLEGVPTSAEVLVRVRAPGTPFDGVVVARTVSAPSGEWSIENMPDDGVFDVVARKEGECDVVKSDVRPLAPLRAVFAPDFCAPIGVTRSLPLSAHGGEGPYTYSVVSGTLPSGIALVGNSLAATAPIDTPGDYPVTIQVEDARSSTASAQVVVRLVEIPLRIEGNLERVTWGVPYEPVDVLMSAAGGYPPYTYSVFSGALPTGVTLDASTGAISGALGSENEKATFVLGVTDSNGGTVALDACDYYTYPYAPHKYWRLHVTAHNGNANVSVTELRFLDPISGAVIPVSTTTAFASSEYHSGYAAAYAFDNNFGTRWAAYGPGDPVPVFVGNVLPGPYAISAFTIIGAGPTDGPKDFSIQSSDDGITWTDEWFVADQTSWTSNQSRTFIRPQYVAPAGESHEQWGETNVS